MPVSFSRTTRSLANESSRPTLIAWGLTALVLIAWLLWLAFARVTVYEVSAAARLEVERAAHPVAALLPGKVLSTSVQLGRHVSAGEVLVELDARSEQLRLQEEEARLRAIPPQLAALERQIADQERAAMRARSAADGAIEQARAREREAHAAASFADENSRRLSQLTTSGRVSEIEALRAQTDTSRARSMAEAAAYEIHRLEADALGKDNERGAALEALRREAAELKGQTELTTATIARLTQEIEKHVLRAPVSGTIGEAPALDVGAFVDEGGVVASVVPSGDMRVVADFEPARVLGRVLPGQFAQMRLDGFPWAQFGTLHLRVERVASEIRDGRIRVELRPESRSNNPHDALLLQHGLPGAVEIEIEQTSPLTLALRAAGQKVTRS
jgi:multidrug resistance efflux pump